MVEEVMAVASSQLAGDGQRAVSQRAELFDSVDSQSFSVLPASVWVKVEAAAVEVDRGLEVLPVAEAAGGVPDPLDLRIQALGGRVGDPVAEVGEDVREVRLEHPRLLDHGRQARVRRPEVPVAEELAGGPDVAVLPEVRGRLLERPGPGHLERAVA